MCNLLLEQHFCSNEHNEKGITIMQIEEVTLEIRENITLASKRLKQEEFWYKELATIYPCGLNDYVKHLGNVDAHLGRGAMEAIGDAIKFLIQQRRW